jgi:hypothetical protein
VERWAVVCGWMERARGLYRHNPVLVPVPMCLYYQLWQCQCADTVQGSVWGMRWQDEGVWTLDAT